MKVSTWRSVKKKKSKSYTKHVDYPSLNYEEEPDQVHAVYTYPNLIFIIGCQHSPQNLLRKRFITDSSIHYIYQ